MADTYKIIDEPTPGVLAKFVVDPVWPLLAFMLVGSWLALPWFIFNSVAVGSPKLRAEILWCVASLAGSAVIVVLLGTYYDFSNDQTGQLKYLFLVLLVWKLGISYVLYSSQSVTVELSEHFGLETKNGIYVLIIAFVLRQSVTSLLFYNTYLYLVAR